MMSTDSITDIPTRSKIDQVLLKMMLMSMEDLSRPTAQNVRGTPMDPFLLKFGTQ